MKYADILPDMQRGENKEGQEELKSLHYGNPSISMQAHTHNAGTKAIAAEVGCCRNWFMTVMLRSAERLMGVLRNMYEPMGVLRNVV